METTRKNRQWILAARPQGKIKESDFRWNEAPLPSLVEGEIIVRTVYISLDPTNRGWMSEADTYLPAVPLGSVVRGIGIGIVEESRNAAFAPGDLVQGMLGWQAYFAGDPTGLSKLPQLPVPLPAYLAALGHIGLTAYFGLFDIGKPVPGNTVVVSAAAGAVGSLVGQLARIKGCRVVGLAGSEDKCRWLRDELDFDAVINYKIENVPVALRLHCPDGIDVYFDNVGGGMLEAALDRMNLHGRIACCGMISQYNEKHPVGPANLSQIISKRVRMEGFLVLDYLARAAEAYAELVPWILSGKLKYRADIVEGLENAPEALNRLFDGANQGKLMLKVSDEPVTATLH